MTRKLLIPNLQDLIQRYESGVSLKQLAQEFGTSRTPLFRAFNEAGVKIRNRREGMLQRWERMGRDPETLEKVVGKAWAAARGKTRTEAELLKRAQVRDGREYRVSRYNAVFLEALESRGLLFHSEYPIGQYNVDMALEELGVAVEIHCDWCNRKPRDHRLNSVSAERIEYLLDRGWAVLIAYIWPGNPSIDLVTDKIVAFVDVLRRFPSLRGQYGMIGRKGQGVTPRGYKSPDRPRIHGF